MAEEWEPENLSRHSASSASVKAGSYWRENVYIGHTLDFGINSGLRKFRVSKNPRLYLLWLSRNRKQTALFFLKEFIKEASL